MSLSHVQFFATPVDHSLPGSSVHGISQAKIMEWVVISFSRGSSWPRDWTLFSCLSGRFLITEPPGKPSYSIEKSESESCSVVSDSLQPRGLYTVHGILQARILEWVAFPFSRGSSQSRDWTQVSHIAGDSLPAEPQGKPKLGEMILTYLHSG